MYTCLFCGKPGYPSACPECMTWVDPTDGTPGIDDIAPDSPPDPDPAPGRALVNWNSGPCLNCGSAHHVQRCPEVLAALFAPRILVPRISTTAREWLDEDRRQDAIARAWSASLLEKMRAA